MEFCTPEEAGFSRERLARINPVMQRYVDEKKLAGVITLIARRGRVVHCETFGKAEVEAGAAMRTDTLFRIYSMTKPITSVAVLMLFEEGAFRLTDPVAQYIPAFADLRVLDTTGVEGRFVAPERPITIHDLLTHTAGLSYGFDETTVVGDRYRKGLWAAREANPEMTLEEFAGEVARLPLAHQPGRRFNYGVATDVLGYLVQVVSKMPFDEFLKQRVFGPLGMPDTDFFVPPEALARFAANYGPDEQNGLKLIDAPQTSRYARPTKNPSGGGGLVSTAPDYLRFARMLLNQGELDGVRLLGRKTVALMTTNALPDGVHPWDNPASGFGLGVSVRLDLGQSRTLGSVGNFGWSGAANTTFWVDPQEELIGILMLQFMRFGTYPVAPEFEILTYQALVD